MSGYLSLFWRRKWVVLPFLILTPLVAYLLAAGGQATYEASAQVLLNQQSQGLSGLDNPLLSQPERVIRTQTGIARLPAIAQRVVNAAQLENGAESFLRRSWVDSKDTADLLTFRVQDQESGRAALLADLYAQKYIDFRRELDTKTLRDASRVIGRRLEKLKAQGLPIDSALYGSLSDRQQQLESAQTLQRSNALLVRRATSEKVAPQPGRASLLALAVGLVLVFSLLLLLETLDTRIREPEDLSGELGLALLGTISTPRRRRGRSGLVMLEDPNGPEAEPYRMLRTSLGMSAFAQGCRSIVVTSGLEAEGKSTTVANLAVALARAGKHVILIDLDLRRPSLGRHFELTGRPGITDIISGRASVEDAAARITFNLTAKQNPVRRSRSRAPATGKGQGSHAIGVLEVIGAGTTDPSPGDFMIKPELGATLERLQARAEIVLVDGPPLLLAGDALVLGSIVDALLLVAKVRTLRRTQVRQLQRILVQSSASTLGVVVTGGAAIKSSAYYGSPDSGSADSDQPSSADSQPLASPRPASPFA